MFASFVFTNFEDNEFITFEGVRCFVCYCFNVSVTYMAYLDFSALWLLWLIKFIKFLFWTLNTLKMFWILLTWQHSSLIALYDKLFQDYVVHFCRFCENSNSFKNSCPWGLFYSGALLEQYPDGTISKRIKITGLA